MVVGGRWGVVVGVNIFLLVWRSGEKPAVNQFVVWGSEMAVIGHSLRTPKSYAGPLLCATEGKMMMKKKNPRPIRSGPAAAFGGSHSGAVPCGSSDECVEWEGGARMCAGRGLRYAAGSPRRLRLRPAPTSRCRAK